MSASSRPSIPPLSRTPISSRPPAMAAAQVVWQRHALVGGTAGLLLSGSAFFPAEWGKEASFQSLILSALFSAIMAGLLLAATGTLVWSIVSSIPKWRRRARLFAAISSSTVLGAYVSGRGIAEAFRISSGSPLNLGTLEFFAEGAGHLAGPVLLEYAPLAAALFVGFLISVGGAFVFLSRGPVGHVAPPLLAWRGGASALGLWGLVQVLLIPGFTSGCGLQHSADISLLSSIAALRAEHDEWALQGSKAGPQIERGAPVSTGQIWETAVPRMSGPRPNVVLIMLESVGTNHLGFAGYDRKTTRGLDRIAQSSVRFSGARSTASHSNYAQMAVLSSLFPRRYSGLDTYRRLDYPRVLWHDFLTALGYRTATFSSQDETWQGMLRFQETGTPTEFHHSGTYEGQHLRMGSEKVVPDEVTAQRAIEWMRNRKEPFGLYLNFQSTHFPYKIPLGAARPFQPDRPTRGKYHYLAYPKEELPTVVNRYDNALSYVDAQIEKIYQFLEESGRLENTILVVTADHGELFWDHGMVTHGRSLYDTELRVPLLIHYPAKLEAREVETPVSTLDILPSLATLLDVPPHPAFQGKSLFEPSSGARPLFMNIQGMKSQDGVQCGSYKLIYSRGQRKSFLFDLASDPGEEVDLYAELPDVADSLEELLRTQMGAQLAYHAPKTPEVRTRYAPRFAACPTLAPSHKPKAQEAQTEVSALDL